VAGCPRSGREVTDEIRHCRPRSVLAFSCEKALTASSHVLQSGSGFGVEVGTFELSRAVLLGALHR
jgi:hypothetical protein